METLVRLFNSENMVFICKYVVISFSVWHLCRYEKHQPYTFRLGLAVMLKGSHQVVRNGLCRVALDMPSFQHVHQLTILEQSNRW